MVANSLNQMKYYSYLNTNKMKTTTYKHFFLLLLILSVTFISSCKYDQAAFVIRNESSDTIRVDFHFDNSSPFIGENKTSPRYIGVDTIGLKTLRHRFGVIKYHDSIITQNLERNPENTRYIFKNYYKDSLPVNEFLIYTGCEYYHMPVSRGCIEYIYTNTNNSKKYNEGKHLCEVLSLPPSQYYKNDTSNYSRLINNILPIYIYPGKTYMTIQINPYGASLAENAIVVFDKIEIIKDKKVIYSFSFDNFKKYFTKTNVFDSRNSYMITIKD